MNARPSRRQLWLAAFAYAGMWVASIAYLVLHHYGIMP